MIGRERRRHCRRRPRPDRRDAAGGARPIWLGYIGVDDVDAKVAKIEAKGGKVMMPAFDSRAVGRMAMVADPQGDPFYVMEPDPAGGRAGRQERRLLGRPAEQHVRWNELWTADPAAARQFYGELFGWAQEGDMPMGEIGEYRFVQHDGTTIGAVMPRDARRAGKQVELLRRRDDIDRAAGSGEGRRRPVSMGRWKSRAATISSSATTRRAPNSRSWARPEEREIWLATS